MIGFFCIKLTNLDIMIQPGYRNFPNIVLLGRVVGKKLNMDEVFQGSDQMLHLTLLPNASVPNTNNPSCFV